MNPISGFDKRRQVSREGLTWSETVVRRRRAVARTESDSDTEAPPPPPPPFPLECSVSSRHSPQRLQQKCSNCSCRKSDLSLKKSNKSYLPFQKIEKKSSDIMLQQLETKLYSAELEDATHVEKLEKVQKRLQRAAQLVETLVLFTQSLDLQARASARLTQLMGNFAYKDINPTEALVQTLDKMAQDVTVFEKLNDIHSTLSSANEPPDQLEQMLDEFKEKRKNYMTASNSFSRYLRSSCHVSGSQLHKFESQWDSLRVDYERSRKLLEREFSKLIDERHDVLQYCFANLAPLQERLVEQDDKFALLSKEVAKSLQEQQKYSENKVAQSQNKLHRQS